jgi:uncharacterized membrane protein YagU involved in acid resistance
MPSRIPELISDHARSRKPLMPGSRIPSAILYGGFIAGTIDIGAAALINRISPLVILRAIASGLLGREAFAGGMPVAWLGLGLQWAMSLLIAAIFVLAARRMSWLTRRWIGAGVLYGAVVFVVMEYVVVPLSAAGKPHFTALSLAENLLAMFVFGLIVAFFARRVSTDAT